MQIEVTEKEAMGIHAQRYLDSKGKKQHLPFAILVLGVVVCLFLLYSFNAWIGIGIFAIFWAFSIYLSVRWNKDSEKHDRAIIGEEVA